MMTVLSYQARLTVHLPPLTVRLPGHEDQVVGVRQLLPSDRPAVRAFVRLEHEFMNGYPLLWSAPDIDVRKQLSGHSA